MRPYHHHRPHPHWHPPAPTGTPTPTGIATPLTPHLCVVACLGPSRDDLGRHPKGRADDGAAARHGRRHLRRHAEVGQLDDAALGEEQVARLRDATRRVHARSTRSAAGALGDRALGGGPHGHSVALHWAPAGLAAHSGAAERADPPRRPQAAWHRSSGPGSVAHGCGSRPGAGGPCPPVSLSACGPALMSR